MPSQLPRNIIRNWTIWADRESLIGQCDTVKLPKLSRKVSDVFNAGMIAEIEVALGFEKIEMGWSMTGYDPQTLKLFGIAVGQEHEFMATAAPTDEDGTVHSAVAYVRGFLKTFETDDLKRGDIPATKYELAWRYVRMTFDGDELFEIDPFRVVVGGVDQTLAERRALLIA